MENDKINGKSKAADSEPEAEKSPVESAEVEAAAEQAPPSEDKAQLSSEDKTSSEAPVDAQAPTETEDADEAGNDDFPEDEDEAEDEEEAEESALELKSEDLEEPASPDDIPTEAYDLEHGEKLDKDEPYKRGEALPWSSKISSAKEFFNTEILYRYDLLESGDKEFLTGKYRVEVKGVNGGVWTLDLSKDISIVNRREDADCVLTMEQEDFLMLINGELNPQLAMLAQKIIYSGEIAKIVALHQVFATPCE